MPESIFQPREKQQNPTRPLETPLAPSSRTEMWLVLSAARHLVGPLPPAARVGARVPACRCAQPEEPHVAPPRRLPEHLAVIMDGNSRWAHREVRRRGLEP